MQYIQRNFGKFCQKSCKNEKKGFGFGKMDILNNFYALKDATAPMESETTTNVQAETLTVQVEGTGAGVSLQLLGCSDLKSDEYHVMTGFTSDFKITNEMTENGIYTFPVGRMGRFKFNLAAIGGGSVTVFCRMTTGV